MSRQYEWQLRQRELGKCTICGEDGVLNHLGKYSGFCEVHLAKNRIAARNRYYLKKPDTKKRPEMKEETT